MSKLARALLTKGCWRGLGTCPALAGDFTLVPRTHVEWPIAACRDLHLYNGQRHFRCTHSHTDTPAKTSLKLELNIYYERGKHFIGRGTDA